jgi:hypothetical protein
MHEITGRSKAVNTILTWTGPPVLVAVSIGVGRLSVVLAPGERPGQNSLFSTPALDLVLFGLTFVGCVVCFVWHRSALLTAAGVIAALWYYSELYLHRSTDPLSGLVYFVTGPLAIICGICGLVGFFSGLTRARRAQAAGTGVEPD